VGAKQKKRMRDVQDLARETQSVLYKFNKKNLKNFMKKTENVIIFDFFLEKAHSVFEKYEDIEDVYLEDRPQPQTIPCNVVNNDH
jgi:hypothetical protein